MGALATRLAHDYLFEMPPVYGLSTLPVDVLVVAAGLGIAVLFLALLGLLTPGRRRSAEPSAASSPAPTPPPSTDPLLETHLEEVRRELADRAEQLTYVRDILRMRTTDMDRLRDERAAMAARVDAAQETADRWRAAHERAVAELQVERRRFAAAEARLTGDLRQGALAATDEARQLIHAVRALMQRTEETDALRANLAGLRAELDRARRLYERALAAIASEVRRGLASGADSPRLNARGGASRHRPGSVRSEEACERDPLLGLIGDLHDVSHAEANALVLKREAVDVKDALRHAARDAADRLRRSPGDFMVVTEPGLPDVLADRGRLSQILAALVDCGGTAQMVLSGRLAGEFVALSVAHPDLTVEDGERLLDPVAVDADDGATRIRLALARLLATLSGGQLTLAASGVTGAVFTLTLPAATLDDRPARPRPDPLVDI
ncbi:MAG TPA: hypothetical protein VKH83_09195 [Methylomirabilota bacterium]|nr:hypothetical protein [Methylomirabilota bacterium]